MTARLLLALALAIAIGGTAARAVEPAEQVLDYLVARYGVFVLLDPPFLPTTWLLWLAPPLLVLGSGGLLLLRARGRRPDPVMPALTQEESTRAALLLADRK